MADDLKQFIKEQGEETRRHFDVVAEDLKSEIKTVAEGVEGANQRLDRFELLPKKVDAIGDGIEVIKVTLDVIKNDLKQKVDRDEFVALERRVGMLETKFRPA